MHAGHGFLDPSVLDGLPMLEPAVTTHDGSGHQPSPWVPHLGSRDTAECGYGLPELSSCVLSTSKPSAPWEVGPQLDQQVATFRGQTETVGIFEGGNGRHAQIMQQQQAALDSLAPVHDAQPLHQARNFAILAQIQTHGQLHA